MYLIRHAREIEKSLPQHLSLYLKCPPRSRLALLPSIGLFRPRSPQHLQEVRGPSPHTRVDVGFAGFDVVVEVVAEGLDVGDGFLALGGGEVAGEEDCNDEN